MRPVREQDAITSLIVDWRRGDRDAENALFAALYDHLHGLALQCLRGESPGHSLSPTMLVHEAYLRFQYAESLEISDRAHFLALSARVMRRIVVDKARARRSAKRGGDQSREEANDALVSRESDADEILAVDRAMEEITKQSARLGQVVELKYFAGFTEDECAAVLGITGRQVRRDWRVAKTRLRIAIDGSPSPN